MRRTLTAPTLVDCKRSPLPRRVEQVISKVPISISAFTQKQMEAQGVKQVDDLVRLTPGLTLQRAPTGLNTISIRGTSAGAGAGTTGVYIDDAPIQVRSAKGRGGVAGPRALWTSSSLRARTYGLTVSYRY